MTTPDRFARLVRAKEGFNGRSDEYYAEQLLRREHAAVVRAVKKLPRYDVALDCGDDKATLGIYKDGSLVSIEDVLAMLERRTR